MSHLKGRTPYFLIFKSSKWRFLNEIKTFPVSAIIAKSQDTGKDCYKFKCLSAFSPLTSLSNVLSILNNGALRNYRGSSQFSLLIGEKYFSWLRMNLFLSWHRRHNLGVQPHYYKAARAVVQTVGIANELHVWVMVCRFHSALKEASPRRPVTPSSVAKVLLEKIVPTWGAPLKRNPFYWLGASTSLHCLASFTTFSLCLPLSILWFSWMH